MADQQTINRINGFSVAFSIMSVVLALLAFQMSKQETVSVRVRK